MIPGFGRGSAKTMDVKTLCLGALTTGDASGYEIKKKLEGSFRRFYEASFGSIYPALGRLQDAGLVTCVEMTQAGKPDKKVYALTGSGRAYLIDELSQPLGSDRIRSEFMVAMVYSHLLPPEHVANLIEERLQIYDESLTELQDCDPDQLPPGRRFVLGYGLAIYQAGREYLAAHRHLVETERETEAPAAVEAAD